MEVKMIWILVTISLALAEKLDRTYLPPPGSPYSGGSPGAIKAPLELQKNKHSSSIIGLPKLPELVIGINRVGPSPAGHTFEDIISTPKPKIIYNGYSSTSPTNTTSAFKQSSPFLKDYLPDLNYNSGHLKNEFDPSTKIFHEKNRVYLPSYGGNNKDDVPFITLPPPFNTGVSISYENKYIQPVIGSNENTPSLNSNDQQFNAISPILSINSNPINANRNILSSPSTASEFSATTPISTIKPPIFYSVGNQRPERVQAQADREAVIFNYEQSITPEGYAYSYDTSNGIHGNEDGTAINGVKAKGSYSYIGDDGNFYQVEYTADENGFVPKGFHLPTAPPVPDAILKVIAQAAKDKEAGIYDDGSYNEDKYGYKKYQKIYPQINNIVNGADFLPGNERIINKDDYEFEDSSEDNGLEHAGESPENELGDIDPVRNSYYNAYNMKNYSSPSTNIVINQSYQNQKPLSKFDLDMPTSDISDKTNLHRASGYEYFAPRTSFYEANTLKPFRNRFSATENREVQPETYENNTEKATAKPFLTPYVTRKYDNSEINDYDEKNGNEYKNMDYDAQPSRNRSEESYRDGLFNKDDQLRMNDKTMNTELGVDSRDLTPGDKLGQQLDYGDRIQNVNDLLPFDKKGNFYQNSNNPSITFNQRVSYTASTPAPTDFPTSISTLDSNTTSVSGSTSFQTPTLSSITTLIDSSTKLTVTTLPTYTTSPVTLDTELTAVNPETYSKADLISTTSDLQTSRPIPTRFGMPYGLTTESSDIKYNDQTSTENIIGEDFSGPKQPQRFDPVSGYHY